MKRRERSQWIARINHVDTSRVGKGGEGGDFDLSQKARGKKASMKQTYSSS